MATTAQTVGRAPSLFGDRARPAAEKIAIPLGALVVSMVVFGLFVAVAGADPFEFYALIYKGAYGTWFSWQNSLQRAAPIILTGLCVALPARLGLVVIGGEGALVLGGLAAAAVGAATIGTNTYLMLTMMAAASMLVGGAWIALAGGLRHYRGVNETISSLLLAYIAIAVMNHLVEGPLRDPKSLNKPSTLLIGDANMIGTVGGMDVHWGLVFGMVCCAVTWVLMIKTPFGFAVRMIGGNPRAARMAGLSVGRITLVTCFIGGAAAGLAGMVEVAAVHGSANASLVVGYGYTGILVAFLARHNPLAILPVALLLGGIDASGGLIQRRLDLPDATVLVLQGVIFIAILMSETLYGRLRIFQPKGQAGGIANG